MSTTIPTFKFPPKLKPEGTIGIISPGRWPLPEWLSAATDLLHDLGYTTVVHSQNYLQQGQLAGSDAARAEAVNDMFADSTIDAVLCACAGAGAVRILDKINYKLIKRNPKPFIGFSDVTLMLHSISRRCGFVTYHGPMCRNLAISDDKRNITDLLAVIGEHDDKRVALYYPDVEVYRHGTVEGSLTGGNISLLQNLVGTHYDWAAKDSILFIEDTEEPLYKIDRMLRHLALAGKFKGVKAVLVGEMTDLVDGETSFAREGERPYGVDLKQILLDVLPPDVPLCLNFPCGHGDYTTTLPIGANVHLTMDARGVSMSFMVA